MANQEELLTTGKISEKFGISPTKIKKAIQTLGLEPDLKKGPCAYYCDASVKKIVSAVRL